MAGKLPYINFFPADWRQDAIENTSPFAQWVWFRCMFLMHEGEPYGHLTRPDGVPFTDMQAATAMRITEHQYKDAMKELKTWGVPSYDPQTGAIFSRRMVRDAEKRKKEAARQKEFQDKKKQKSEPKNDPPPNPTVPQVETANDTASAVPDAVGGTSDNGGAKKDSRKQSGADPRHAEFTAAWCNEYPKFFKGLIYNHKGGVDGKQLQAFLKANKDTVDILMDVARNAWNNPNGFWCKQAATVSGFCTKFNEIRNELINPTNTNGRHSSPTANELADTVRRATGSQ